MFPSFTGHGPCPKCGANLLTCWHEAGYTDWVAPPMALARPCYEVDGWPRVEAGPLDLEDEEHLHRVCEGCGYQAVEALASPEFQVVPLRYEQVYGLKQINEKAAAGWRVAAAFMAADIIALMVRP